MGTIMEWQTGLPEESGIEIFESLGCDCITVLVTGRYQTDGGLSVRIVNRIRRKKTGYQQIDESDALGVPLDEQWHWQSGMAEIVAWSPLPKEDDLRWISCQERLPEDTEEIHKDGRMEMMSVMALCEVFKGFPDVYLVNRLRVHESGTPYLDRQVTDGWVWSKNGEKAKAWMPFPEPAKEPSVRKLPNQFNDEEIQTLKGILEMQERTGIQCDEELSGVWLHSDDFKTELRLLLLKNLRMTVSRVCFVNRRRGTMTTIKDFLVQMCRSRQIPLLVIQCVETPEMAQWCLKNEFLPNPNASLEIDGVCYGDYIKKINSEGEI